ncbi:MAG: type II toxin-antitoxin system HicA family toxin [Endomicrobiia bacterium]|nr:type II toxin-antitoxin system HicA family toxin [Endomicrobiia bacterium]
MTRLPVIAGKRIVGILLSRGFVVVRQKGSHVSLRKGQYCVVVPLHRELAKGTLLSVLRQAGLTKDDLLRDD